MIIWSISSSAPPAFPGISPFSSNPPIPPLPLFSEIGYALLEFDPDKDKNPPAYVLLKLLAKDSNPPACAFSPILYSASYAYGFNALSYLSN